MKTSFAVGLGLVGLGLVLGLAIGGLHSSSLAEEAAQPAAAGAETLLTSELEDIEGYEVLVSRVTLPPHFTLPKHWHPGVEISFLLEGSAVLWQEGETEIAAKQGDVLEVPPKKVHSASTSDEGATVLVVRIHEKGKPERVLVED